LNGSGGKPKGLHWATYQRLKAEHDRLGQVSFRDIGRKFGFLHYCWIEKSVSQNTILPAAQGSIRTVFGDTIEWHGKLIRALNHRHMHSVLDQNWHNHQQIRGYRGGLRCDTRSNMVG